MPPAINLSQVRGALGATHLFVPSIVAGPSIDEPSGRTGRWAVRALGVRQLIQALATGTRPTRAVLLLGAEVDAAHAASMVLLAVCSERWRRPALLTGLIGMGLAAAGVATALAGERPPVLADRPSTEWSWVSKQDMAEHVARLLVPGWLLRYTGPLEWPGGSCG